MLNHTLYSHNHVRMWCRENQLLNAVAVGFILSQDYKTLNRDVDCNDTKLMLNC